MRRARRARHAWRDEPRAESGRSAQPGPPTDEPASGCGDHVAVHVRRAAPAARRGPANVLSLSSHRAPFIPRSYRGRPGTAPGQRGVSAARRARRSIPGRVTSPATSTPETPPPPRRGVHRGRSVSDRTPVNRPRGRPVRVRRARALIDGRDSEHRPMFTDDYHLPTRNSGPWMANRQSHATACHLGSRDISGRMSIIRRPGAASLDIVGRLVTAPRFCRPVTPRRSRRRARRALHGAARA